MIQTLLYIFIGLILLLVVVGVLWRISSRHHSLPCPVWLGWLVELDNPLTKTNRAATILQQLKLTPGMKVLDAGCGPGRVTIPAAQKVGGQGRVVALDIQQGMLARARAKAEQAGLDNIDFVQAGLGEGMLTPGYFDRALLVTVLGEVPDQAAAIREIFDALKPGGLLSVTEIMFDPHYQRRSRVTRLAGAAGFRETQFFGNRIAYTLHFIKPNA